MERLLSMKDVQERLPLSRAQIDRYVHDPEYEHLGFPKPIKIGFRVLWREVLVDNWIKAQIAKQAS